ncbi:ATP-binding cassette domain-containing protein [Pseudokineococcus lusitanus]|uniref:ABC-2 type transport system ATP-binding protein n=1 Tax=Pseudokineococcus lusitanus TaxID=763993 RepID=A0A3N1HNE9_9ACTN|nr:ATP-binding cassette domain-containing protein [Pseudokineococcus lusitanus]ROP44001.1 ABC-2 type transport system ATP-binding protein [Pseudokineococcus lusitanus]
MTSTSSDHPVVAEGLVKRYGEVRALDGLDLAVPRGSVLGVLGPNGAGKTTAVRVLTTLLRPDAGRAVVAGVDVLADPKGVRRRIGVSGQYAAVDEELTGRENLTMVGDLYHLGRGPSRDRARELLERFTLTDAADRPVKTYSGGMRRRLDLAGALVAEPEVLFLDEPTTGLDPRSRLDMWDVIAELVSGGTTLLLTTQYLEEADRLADSIAVIDRGHVIAEGTADELKSQVGGERLELTVGRSEDLGAARDVLARSGTGEITADEHSRTLSAPVTGGAAALVRVLTALGETDVEVLDAGVRRPTLDDVFLTLTGRGAEEAAAGDGDGGGRKGRGRGRRGGRHSAPADGSTGTDGSRGTDGSTDAGAQR